jgi:tetratricopeptide (TPR) repeat protein
MSGKSNYDDDSSGKATVPAHDAASDARRIRSLERLSQVLGIGLAISTLLVVVLGVAFLLFYSQEQKARHGEASQRATDVDREVTAALNDAHERSELAKGQTEDPQKCQATLVAAEEALKRADAMLKTAGSKDDLTQKTKGLRDDVELNKKALDDAKKALELGKQLDTLRLRRPDGKQQAVELANAYDRAFKDFGLDVRVLEAPLSAPKLQALANRDAVFDGALDWATVTPNPDERQKLLKVVNLAEFEPNSAFKKVADAMAKTDRSALIALAKGDLQSMPPRTIRRLADALLQVGADAEALKVLRDAHQIFPQDFWLTYTLGSILVQRHGARERADALRFLTAAAALRGPSASLYNNLGLALKLNGEIADAVTAYEKAKTYDSSNIALLNNLGVARLLKGDLDGAFDVLQYAVSIDDKRVESQINLGVVLQAKGDLRAAIERFKEALKIDDNSAIAHTSLGLALEADGDIEGAIAEHKIALRIDAKSVQAHNNLGTAQVARGEIDDALLTFEEALKIDPQFPATHINLGAALRLKGDLDGALRSFQTAAELNPRDGLPHEHVAFTLGLKGDLVGAIREYRTALELNPHSAAAYLGLAKDLVDKGQLAEASAVLKDALAPGRIADSNKQKRLLQVQLNEYVTWVKLDERLRPVLIGEDRFVGPEDQIALGRMCLFFKHLYVSAGVFYAEAFGARPELANDLRNTNRFDAACAAALAGTGQGEDVAALQERDKQVWRERARHWLEEDLAQWSKLAASDKPPDRAMTRAAMFRWKQERYLAGIRNKDALQKLPEGERAVFQKLWDDVDAVLKRAGATKG